MALNLWLAFVAAAILIAVSPGPGAAIRMSDTSSTLKTTGSLRGSVRNCM